MKTFKEMAQVQEKTDGRYVVQVEMYMWDKDDTAVIKQAEKLAKSLQKKDDNQAEVISIVSQEFGTIGNRKVK